MEASETIVVRRRKISLLGDLFMAAAAFAFVGIGTFNNLRRYHQEVGFATSMRGLQSLMFGFEVWMFFVVGVFIVWRRSRYTGFSPVRLLINGLGLTCVDLFGQKRTTTISGYSFVGRISLTLSLGDAIWRHELSPKDYRVDDLRVLAAHLEQRLGSPSGRKISKRTQRIGAILLTLLLLGVVLAALGRELGFAVEHTGILLIWFAFLLMVVLPDGNKEKRDRGGEKR